MTDHNLDILNDLIAKAKAGGADGVDALLVESTSISHAHRLGRPEQLERSETTDVGLRILIGRRQALASSSDVSRAALDQLVERGLAMARSVPEDPFCGLADPDQLAGAVPDIDMCDALEPSPETLVDWAAAAEEAARAVPGVTNSEGAEASWGRSRVALAASNGFARTYAASRFSLSASVLAGEGTAMERDYDYSGAVFAEDLRSPEDIGRSAGERAVRRLNPRKAATAQVPIIYDPRASRSLLGHLASAVNGTSVARGTSFLKDRMGETLFPADIRIVDDPLRRRGLRSKPFDAEGIATRPFDVIAEGKLTGWILDLRSARQLGLATSGHASRGPTSVPSPSVTNFYLAPGKTDPVGLMSDIKNGFYVTELIGMGVNMVTGDYSRGAAGFWIEDGEATFPVSEVTIAGNLKDMFANLTAADDLVFRYGLDAPTVRIDGLTVAGT